MEESHYHVNSLFNTLHSRRTFTRDIRSLLFHNTRPTRTYISLHQDLNLNNTPELFYSRIRPRISTIPYEPYKATGPNRRQVRGSDPHGGTPLPGVLQAPGTLGLLPQWRQDPAGVWPRPHGHLLGGPGPGTLQGLAGGPRTSIPGSEVQNAA